MDNQKLHDKIVQDILAHPDVLAPYEDYFSLVREVEAQDFAAAHGCVKWLNQQAYKGLNQAAKHMRLDDAEAFDRLVYRTLVFDAPYEFDAYLQAVEYDRPVDKQFYRPRRHYLKRYVDGYQKILDGELDFLSISMPKRCGKAVTLDTLIPTPLGFKRMGDIHVGDLVMARDGYDTKVTDVFPQGKVPVYAVEFDDGAVVKTCGEHLWKVRWHDVSGHHGKYTDRVMTTKEILDSGLRSEGKNAHNLFSVEYCDPAEFIYREVPLDPYVLGVLIGDGCLRDNCVNFTKPDREIADFVSKHLPAGDVVHCQDEKKSRFFIKSAARRVDERGVPMLSQTATALRELGLLGKYSWQKFIPDSYLYTTSVMRLELLAGLLDTDGYVTQDRIEFSTTSSVLCEQVKFLVRSLGGKATSTSRMGKYRKSGVVVETRENYRVSISFPSTVEIPFKVSRKNVYAPKHDKLYHRIVSITSCGMEEAQCIRVDNEEHLFLVGDHFIPTHNSQLGINFVNMLSGKFPDRATLMEGTGDDLVKSFYHGCLEYLVSPSEYNFHDIFPEAPLVETNAESKKINLHRKSRFPTIMCRSIDARQVGLSEATNLLYLDDCVEGRDEAKNRVRLDEKWEILSGDIIGRAIEGTPIVICGTRYSIYDPIGHLQEEMTKQGKRMLIIETPALDPITDESNFEYVRDGVKVFTTKYFRDQREMLTEEQFESEFQQQPFEANGILFPKNQLNYYYSLPEEVEPDAIIAVCDTADKGADYCSMPIAAVYGTEAYIIDWVFDDGVPDKTKPECAAAIIRNNVKNCTFESNNAGEYFGRDVGKILEDKGFACGISMKRSISNKQTRIVMASDVIIKHFWFKHESLYERNSQYAWAMKQLVTHTHMGKVPHDDAPDSLAMLVDKLGRLSAGEVKVVKRPF